MLISTPEDKDKNINIIYNELHKRCLYRSIDALIKLDMINESNINYNINDIENINDFNLKNYYRIYSRLKCINFNTLSFCICCNINNNFIRAYAYILYKKINKSNINTIYNIKYTEDNNIIDNNNNKNIKRFNELDSYELYLLAIITKEKDIKLKILLMVIKYNNYIWDAYREIIDIIEIKDITIVDKALLKVERKIVLLYSLELYIQKFIKNSYFKEAIEYFKFICNNNNNYNNVMNSNNYNNVMNSNNYNNNTINNNNINNTYNNTYNNIKRFANNILGGVYYHLKDYKQSVEYFKEVINNDIYVEYLDLYSNILYIWGEYNKLSILAVNCGYKYPFVGESMCVIGNYYSLAGEHIKAIEYFKKGLKLDKRFIVNYVLVGHEYMEMKKYGQAVGAYGVCIGYNNGDYRAWFGMGQTYSSINAHYYSMYFYKRAVELKGDDSYMWINLGHSYNKLKKVKESINCYKRAIELKDVEGYLYAGDIYKNLRNYKEAVFMYEEYVKRGGEMKIKIIDFLKEYYTKIGDKDKIEYYN